MLVVGKHCGGCGYILCWLWVYPEPVVGISYAGCGHILCLLLVYPVVVVGISCAGCGYILWGHSTGRKRHFLSGYDSAAPLPAHRHRYGLAQVPILGFRSLKPLSRALRPFVEWPCGSCGYILCRLWVYPVPNVGIPCGGCGYILCWLCD